VVLLTAAPALAANKDIERLQVQVAGLQGQMAELQRVAEESLREVRRLNEALAEQNALTKRSLQDQRTQDDAIAAALKDLTERLAVLAEKLEALKVAQAPPVDPALAAAGDTGGGGPAPGAPSPPPPAPRELYSQAYADYARGNYDLAIQAFTEYIRAYPGTEFTDNAQYWIGECLYGKQKYTEAIEGWNALFRDYPSSDKLPDARVKKGMALERLGRRSQALVEYRFVVDRFPNSPAARIARERLNP
jgi:tol-pal system protein YbgF